MENENIQETELEEKNGSEGENEGQKPELTPEQIQGIKKRQLTKLAKELGVELPKPESKTEEPPVKKEGFDNADLALLAAKGIPDEDIDFVEENAKNTGKSLRDLLGTKWFQSELQERKEERITKEAIPSATNRSGGSAKDSVEYWTGMIDAGKAKLSDIADIELRRKVNNTRAGASQGSGKFSSEPVIGG